MIGLEPTFEEHLANLVDVFREVRRVLRKDGTLWLNYGDAYFGGKGASNNTTEQLANRTSPTINTPKHYVNDKGGTRPLDRPQAGLKPKDLMMMPAQVAIALRQPHLKCRGCLHVAHETQWGRWPNGRRICPGCEKSKGCEVETPGWYLRSEIVWHKKNPMPESCQDRPTSAHEKMFLLSKSAKYFYDSFAVREGAVRGKMGHGREMPSMRTSERARPLERVQEVRGGTDAEVARRSPRAEPGDRPPLQGEPSRQGSKEEIPPVRCEQGNSTAVSPDPRGESGDEAVSADPSAERSSGTILEIEEGERKSSTLSRDGQGQSEVCTSRSQAPHADRRVNPNVGRMESNSEQSRQPVPLLWGDGEVDDGPRYSSQQGRRAHSDEHRSGVPELQREQGQQESSANLRNVWKIATHSFKGVHFATFPPDLVEPCIKAGTSEKGVCVECGAPWVRIVEKSEASHEAESATKYDGNSTAGRLAKLRQAARAKGSEYQQGNRTLGWKPSCDCNADTVPAVVLDPFSGSGTVGLVAQRLHRDAILIEINGEYCDMAELRIRDDVPLFSVVNRSR